MAALFPGAGVLRQGSSWQMLSPNEAAAVAVNAGGDVAAAFAGHGVWSYLDSAGARAAGWPAGWNHLTRDLARHPALDDHGNFAGHFPGAGLWYDAVGTWRQLTAKDPLSFSLGG